MARPREPIDLLVEKGKKHLTEAEIKERKNAEIKVGNENVIAPDYLSKKQKAEFNQLASELIKVGIMTNLDCDTLARYIIAQANYIKFTKILKKLPANVDNLYYLEKATNVQDKAFKQCQAAARDLGLTITSRCKLVVPQKEKIEKKNKFEKFEKSGAG